MDVKEDEATECICCEYFTKHWMQLNFGNR